MRVGAAEAPELTDEQVDNVDAMLAFEKATPAEEASVLLDFNHLVTNENMRNILGYDIPISDLPFLKGKEKVPEGPKKSKEHEKAPKTVKKLLVNAQRIDAEQEAKAKKAAEKKAVEKKTTELKATEKLAGKSKASHERPQLGKEPEREPVKKKPRIEAARLYLKSIGSVVKGIPIRAEPLSMITSEHSLQDAEEEATPHHLSLGGVPVLRDEDVLSAQPAGQDVTLTSMAGEEVAQTALPESHSALPQLLTAQVEIEVETRQISQPEVAVEVSDDAGSIPAEADSAVVMVNNRPSVYPVVEEAEPSCSMPFVGVWTDQVGPTAMSTYDSIGFFRPAREYEYDKASLEERLAGLIMDVIRALTPANYLGQSTAGFIPTEDMIDALVRLQTMHGSFHRDQVPVIAGLQQQISELELELARRQSLKSEVARLNKLLAERELELAKHDELVADAELRRNAVEETS
ncbi:uncharacterized protein LOC133856730 [Alnus glutinosa]|uniref:uncharacterized protein LOC133856730 n=1 Tax=Alnus glutinosa TaxID=3517 RepID=UPI002D76D2DA|nr:uncharacterized protein LOC133856730 [Alnus glutinosa]